MHYNLCSVMFKRVIVAFISMVLLVPYTGFVQSDSSKIALKIDGGVYSIGMKVNVVGQVLGSFDPVIPLLISFKGSDGNTYHSASIKLDYEGAFTYEFVIDDNASIGRSTLEVSHETIQGSIEGKISFEVKDRASVTVQPSKTRYKLGENVILSGRISPVLPESQVLIQVFNPKNNAWTFKSVSTDMISSNGQFSVELGKLDGKLSLVGNYAVKVWYAASTATATVSFSVDSDSVDSYSTDSPSQSSSQSSTRSNSNSQAGIHSKVKIDENVSESNSTSSVAKETVIQSKIRNNEIEEQEFTYIVLIKDSEGLTVSLSWASGKLDPSQTMTMEQSWVPDIPGIYTVEIFVWASFENPLVLSPVVLKNIIVQ